MNRVALCYQIPLDSPNAEFVMCVERWARTYKLFEPGFAHDLHVVFCNGNPSPEQRKLFKPFKPQEHIFTGTGWDIAAYQHMAMKLQLRYDLIVFLNARAHFWKSGWLARLMEGRANHFDPNGLYGISTSLERSPHIRTAAFATSPDTLSRYPYIIDSREKGFRFESGEWNFCQWYNDMGYTVVMVAWDGEYRKPDWRKPQNIFRRGDQSNMLVHDRHTDIFAKASEQERLQLSALADGKPIPRFMTRLRDTTTLPPGGFAYTQPETGYNKFPKMSSWSDVISAVTDYRRGNNLPGADEVTVAKDVHAFNCERLGNDPQFCSDGKMVVAQKKTSQPQEKSAEGAGLVERAKQYLAAPAIAKDWLGDDLRPVSQAHAQARGDICTGRLTGNRCPKNAKSGWSIPMAMARTFHKHVEAKNQMKLKVEGESELGTCSGCACNLPLKVWVPFPHIHRNTSDNTYAMLDPRCWMLKEKAKLA